MKKYLSILKKLGLILFLAVGIGLIPVAVQLGTDDRVAAREKVGMAPKWEVNSDGAISITVLSAKEIPPIPVILVARVVVKNTPLHIHIGGKLKVILHLEVGPKNLTMTQLNGLLKAIENLGKFIYTFGLDKDRSLVNVYHVPNFEGIGLGETKDREMMVSLDLAQY